MTVGLDDDHAGIGHPASGKTLETGHHVGWNDRRASGVEAEFDGCGYFVDVLAPGTSGAHEAELEVALVQRQSGGDVDHDF
jgi:hypothetical protein